MDYVERKCGKDKGRIVIRCILVLVMAFFVSLCFPAKTEAAVYSTWLAASGSLNWKVTDNYTGDSATISVPVKWNVAPSSKSETLKTSEKYWDYYAGSCRFIAVTKTTKKIGNVTITVSGTTTNDDGVAGGDTFTKTSGSNGWSSSTSNGYYTYMRVKVQVTLPAGYVYSTSSVNDKAEGLCQLSLNYYGDANDNFGQNASTQINNPIKTTQNEEHTVTGYYLVNVINTGLRSLRQSISYNKYKGGAQETVFTRMPYKVYYQEDESTGATSANTDTKRVGLSSALRSSGTFTKKGYTQTGWQGFSMSKNNTVKTECTYDLGESLTAPYSSDGIYRYASIANKTIKSGTTTSVDSGAKANSLSLWPVWKAHTLSVKLDGNGASLKSGKSDSDESLSISYGDGTTLAETADIYETPEDKYALTWNTKADGSGETYAFGTDLSTVSTIEENDETDLTLYAIWSDTDSFTVYNPPITPPSATTKAKVRIVKKNSKTAETLSGATFSVSVNGGTAQSYTSDENGKLEFDVENTNNLTSGTITATVQETKAPSGYKLDSTVYSIVFNVDENGKIIMDNGSTDSSVLHYSSYDDSGDELIYIVDIGNNPDTKDLIIKKTDADTGAIVPGAKFTLKGVSGNAAGYIQENVPIGSEGTVAFRDLKTGIYSLTETTVPTGYKLPNVTYTVTVTSGGVTISK